MLKGVASDGVIASHLPPGPLHDDRLTATEASAGRWGGLALFSSPRVPVSHSLHFTSAGTLAGRFQRPGKEEDGARPYRRSSEGTRIDLEWDLDFLIRRQSRSLVPDPAVCGRTLSSEVLSPRMPRGRSLRPSLLLCFFACACQLHSARFRIDWHRQLGFKSPIRRRDRLH